MSSSALESRPAPYQGRPDPLPAELYRAALVAADRILRRDELTLEELAELVATLKAIHEALARPTRRR